MNLESLYDRYGGHVAKRVEQELTASEFKQVKLEDLPSYLEARAEFAHKGYQTQLENPFANKKPGVHTDQIDILYRRWCDAEELAYLVTVAEDVSSHPRTAIGGQ